MRKVLLITGLLLIVLTTVRAQTVSYEYDASGNRVKRIMIHLKGASMEEEKEEEPIETSWGEREVIIYPNPTKGNLKIRIKGGDAEEADYKYTLFNTGGQILQQKNIQGLGEYPLQMKQYKTGVYILVLQEKDEKMTFKIMKE